MEAVKKKAYLGASAWIEWDGRTVGVYIAGEDGKNRSNTVYLHPEGQVELLKFFESILKDET